MGVEVKASQLGNALDLDVQNCVPGFGGETWCVHLSTYNAVGFFENVRPGVRVQVVAAVEGRSAWTAGGVIGVPRLTAFGMCGGVPVVAVT